MKAALFVCTFLIFFHSTIARTEELDRTATDEQIDIGSEFVSFEEIRFEMGVNERTFRHRVGNHTNVCRLQVDPHGETPVRIAPNTRYRLTQRGRDGHTLVYSNLDGRVAFQLSCFSDPYSFGVQMTVRRMLDAFRWKVRFNAPGSASTVRARDLKGFSDSIDGDKDSHF